MKRHNRRLHRVARAVLEDETEAEDVVQETYFHAFTQLSEFRGEARLSTWLTRIALNEALGGDGSDGRPSTLTQSTRSSPLPDAREPDPEEAAAVAEIRRLLERALNDLPEPFRVVFVMRDVEEMEHRGDGSPLGFAATDSIYEASLRRADLGRQSVGILDVYWNRLGDMDCESALPPVAAHQNSTRITTRLGVGRLTSLNPAAAKMLRLPTWSSPQVISCPGSVIIG